MHKPIFDTKADTLAGNAFRNSFIYGLFDIINRTAELLECKHSDPLLKREFQRLGIALTPEKHQELINALCAIAITDLINRIASYENGLGSLEDNLSTIQVSECFWLHVVFINTKVIVLNEAKKNVKFTGVSNSVKGVLSDLVKTANAIEAGCISQDDPYKEYLEYLYSLTAKYDANSIYDEILSIFNKVS